MRDIYFAQRQILKALPKLAKAAKSEELKSAFLTHRDETEGMRTGELDLRSGAAGIGFSTGIPIARRSFLSRSERLRLLLRLWACGQRGCVVHHVHGPSGAGDRLAPDRHRRAVRQRLMRTPFVVEGEPFSNAARNLAAFGVALEIDVLVLQRAPQPLDEHYDGGTVKADQPDTV